MEKICIKNMRLYDSFEIPALQIYFVILHGSTCIVSKFQIKFSEQNEHTKERIYQEQHFVLFRNII